MTKPWGTQSPDLWWLFRQMCCVAPVALVLSPQGPRGLRGLPGPLGPPGDRVSAVGSMGWGAVDPLRSTLVIGCRDGSNPDSAQAQDKRASAASITKALPGWQLEAVLEPSSRCLFLGEDFICLLSFTGSHWVSGPPWDPRSTWESGMYLSRLEGGLRTSPDSLIPQPYRPGSHTCHPLSHWAAPTLSQDELSINTWGTWDIARGGISMRSRAREK